MPGVFRRRWFPRRVNGASLLDLISVPLSGVQSTADVGSLALLINTNPSLSGVEATSGVGVLTGDHPSTFLDGVVATAEAGTLTGDHPSVFLDGVVATTATGTLTGDHPSKLLVGVSATAQVGDTTVTRSPRLVGLRVTAEIPSENFFISRSPTLTGLYVVAQPEDAGNVIYPAGGGGGGGAGLFGDGEPGQVGSDLGVGGYGGAADGFQVPRQLTPSADGNNGTEFDGSTIGNGSGGAGGSWSVSAGIGGDGGNGGLYGGGGAGGGAGPNGGGLGGLGGDGVIYIEYVGTSGLVKIILTKNDTGPFIIPDDWSSTNKIILVGPGGCGSDGTTTTGGDGGRGGDTVGVENTLIFQPGDILDFNVPEPCSETATTFDGDNYAAGGGSNAVPGGGSGGETTGSIPFTGPGSFTYSGGRGGTGGKLSGLHVAPQTEIPSVSATAEVGTFALGGVPGNRTFIIAGINQSAIAAGIVLLPTSEDYALTVSNYIIASSQFYTVGEVRWDGQVKVEGVDWEYFTPASHPTLKHIIHILTPGTVSTDITLVFYKWDIGVRSGFKVNVWPVPFGFTGTSIIAERVPPVDDFFTIEYTAERPGNNPRTMFAMFPQMVDDMLEDHTVYDGTSGFQTFRPETYKVYNTSDNNVYEWIGSVWISLGQYPVDSDFYVKRLRKVFHWDGVTASLAFTAGDGASSVEQVISDNAPKVYPLFGESIAYNFLIDAFTLSAPVDFPSAAEIADNPGDYDPWVPNIDS